MRPVALLVFLLVTCSGWCTSPAVLQWNADDIRASWSKPHSIDARHVRMPDAGDAQDLNIVLHDGPSHITVLAGRQLTPLDQIRLRSKIATSPQFTRDGRYVFLSTVDGWVSKVDLQRLGTISEIRVGAHVQSMAISGDGRYIAVANSQPQTVVILDADLRFQKLIPVRDRSGKFESRVSSVLTLASRQSFVVALTDIAEVWEISYNPTAPEIPLGVIHDFQYREGAFAPGFLNPVRTTLAFPLQEFTVIPGTDEILAASTDASTLNVVNLDVRRPIARWQFSDAVDLGRGHSWIQQNATILATASKNENSLHFIDLGTGKSFARLQYPGRIQFLLGHDEGDHLWVVCASPGMDTSTVSIVEKTSLNTVNSFSPIPGKRLNHLTTSRHGDYFVASVEGRDGLVIAYDTHSLQEIKRLRVYKPKEIFNVPNSNQLKARQDIR